MSSVVSSSKLVLVKLVRMPAPTLTDGVDCAKAAEKGAASKSVEAAAFRPSARGLVFLDRMNYSPEVFFSLAAEASGGIHATVWVILRRWMGHSAQTEIQQAANVHR